MGAFPKHAGERLEVETARANRPERTLQLVWIVGMMMVFVDVNELLKPAKGIGKRILQSGAMLLRTESARYVDPAFTEQEVWKLTPEQWRQRKPVVT